MLIEFLDNKILIDKTPIMENIRLNIVPEKRQLRLKLNHLKGDDTTPIDIVIFNMSPSIEILNVVLVLDGKEMNTNIHFRVKLSYDILKGKFKISGSIGNKEVKYIASNIKDIELIINEICSIFK